VSTLGYGLLFVTHDDAFAAQIEHSPLRLSDGAVLS
jgi:ABC-type sulfate/molybdate transport systems ATPase subunit